MLSVASPTFPVPTNIPCSYDYNILHNIKCEHSPAENLQEGSVGNLNGHRVNDWRSIKCEEQLQDLNEQQCGLPSMDMCQVSTSTCDVNQLTEVKREKKADSDEHGRSRGETRQWIVDKDGLLKEVKAEQTLCASVVLPVEDSTSSENVKIALYEIESQLNVHDIVQIDAIPFTRTTRGKSLASSCVLKGHKQTQTDGKQYRA